MATSLSGINVEISVNNGYTQGLSELNTTLIQKLSTATFTISLANAAVYGKIKDWSVNLDGETYSGTSDNSNSVSFNAKLISDKSNCDIVVTTSSGSTLRHSEIVSAIPYEYPYPMDAICYRCDANGNEDDSGENLFVEVTKEFASLSSVNRCKIELHYVSTDMVDSGSKTILGYNSENTTFSGLVADVTLDKSKSYIVTLIAYDLSGYSRERSFSIASEACTIHIAKGGKSIGIGKKAESYFENVENGRLGVAWNTHFDKDITVDEQSKFNGKASFLSNVSFFKAFTAKNKEVPDDGLILNFAETCDEGITFITTTGGANNENSQLPSNPAKSYYAESLGFVHKNNSKIILGLMDYYGSTLAINCYTHRNNVGKIWQGWKYITLQ